MSRVAPRASTLLRRDDEARAAPRGDAGRALPSGGADSFVAFRPPRVESTLLFSPHVKPDPGLQLHTERSWRLESGEATQVALRSVGPRERPPIPNVHEASEGEIRARLVEVGETRAGELTAGQARRAGQVTPEDGSVGVRAFHLAAFRDGGQEYAYALARVGKQEGFSVVLRVASTSLESMQTELARRKLDNVQLQPISDATLYGPQRLDAWSEDQGELLLDGTVSVLPSLPQAHELLAQVLAERQQRLVGRLGSSTADNRFAVIGAVSERSAQRALAAVAVGRGAQLRVSTAYLEGGNSLAGTLPSGDGYLIVGKDSLCLSRLLLQAELGRAVTSAEVVQRAAEDCGIEPRHVFAVEQPGEFHLDMKMMLLRGGHVVVNDSVEAAHLQAGWLRDEHTARQPTEPAALAQWEAAGRELEAAIASEAERARVAAAAEALTAQDLTSAGLVVHRMAGVFAPVAGHPAMNFLNGEAAANAHGDHFYVTLGGDARAEQYVVSRLAAFPNAPDRVHFISRSLSADTLKHFGGLSCRAKLEAVQSERALWDMTTG